MNNVKDIMKLCLPRDAKINKVSPTDTAAGLSLNKLPRFTVEPFLQCVSSPLMSRSLPLLRPSEPLCFLSPVCVISSLQEAILWLQEKAADFQAILTEAVLQDCEVKTEAGDEETCAKVKHLNSALRALGKSNTPSLIALSLWWQAFQNMH